MRESIGNAYLYTFVIIFVIIFVAFLVGSISYSKAFKIKNVIINTIEKNEGWNATTENEINDMLASIGYSVTPNGVGACPEFNGVRSSYNRENGYFYCVYRLNEFDGINTNVNEYRGEYYRVVTFISFDIPVINGVLRIPVQGETKNIFDLRN